MLRFLVDVLTLFHPLTFFLLMQIARVKKTAMPLTSTAFSDRAMNPSQVALARQYRAEITAYKG